MFCFDVSNFICHFCFLIKFQKLPSIPTSILFPKSYDSLKITCQKLTVWRTTCTIIDFYQDDVSTKGTLIINGIKGVVTIFHIMVKLKEIKHTYITFVFQETRQAWKVKIYLRVGLSVSWLCILQLLVITLRVFHSYKIASRIIHLISDFRTREPCLNSHLCAVIGLKEWVFSIIFQFRM